MENLKKTLQKSIMERFNQANIITGIQDIFKSNAEKITFEKYKDIKIKKGKYEYELLGVKAQCYSDETEYDLSAIHLTLTYVVVYKITKQQYNKVKRLKAIYNYEKNIPWYDEEKFGKLFISVYYTIEIDSVISKEINLEIKDQIIKPFEF